MTINKTVLIADGSRDPLASLSQRCKAMDLNVVTATDGDQAMTLIAEQPPNLAIFDLEMLGDDGLRICQQIARDAGTPAIPVIVLTGRSYADAISHCEALGAYYVFKDKQTWKTISSIIQNELGPRPAANPSKFGTKENSEKSSASASRPKILVVDDDLNILEAFKISLSTYGADVVTAENGMEGFTVALVETPDVIVADYAMPGGSGEYLLNRLKTDSETKDIPVIIITGRTFDQKEDVALKRDLLGRGGAVAYLNKPLNTDLFIGILQKYVVLSLEH